MLFLNLSFFFLWFVYAFMTSSPWYGIILTSVLLALTVWSYNMAAFTNPGNPLTAEWENWAAGLAEACSSSELNNCKVCKFQRPDRAHHCRLCGICILRMDHHCPWVGNCIGWRNHKYFVLLTWWGAWACLAALATARGPDAVTALRFVVGPANMGDSGHVLVKRLIAAAMIAEIVLMLLCITLFVEDMIMAASNTNRIEIASQKPNPYRLPRASDNFRQLFGSFGVRSFFPVPPEGRSSDGTSFRSGMRQCLTAASSDSTFEALEVCSYPSHPTMGSTDGW